MKIITQIAILSLILLVCGCTDDPYVAECGNDALAIIDYNVNPVSRIYPKDLVTMVFWLGNHGSYDATDVEVKFFDKQEFEIEKIDCEDGNGIEDGCKIDEIEATEGCKGDIKKIYVELRAPEEGERTVSFSVNYDYSGNSKLMFSIWKKGVENQWGSKQTSSTYGPIKVDIDSEFLLQIIIHDQQETVTEWLEEGQKFTLNLDAKNIGNGDVPVEIDKDDFKVKFNYLHPVGDNCDFVKSGDHYILKKSVKIPLEDPLKCDLVADNIDHEWVSGGIEVEYTYRYIFIEQEEFVVE